MNIFKKKKNKVLFLSVLSSTIVSVSLGSIMYFATSDSNLGKSIFDLNTKDSNLIPNDKLDLPNSTDSTRDNNIAELPKPKPILPNTKLNPPTIVPPKPKPKPELPKVTPKPPSVSPKPKPGRVWTQIVINGVLVDAEITPKPERNVSQADKDRGIANLNPYQNQIVSELHSIKVTEKLKKEVINKAINSGERVGLFDDFRVSYITNEIVGDNLDIAERMAIGTENNKYNWENILHRFKRLLDSPNVVKFLKPQAQQDYPNKKFKNQIQRYIWLIANLDQSKFTKMSKGAEANLEKGLTIDPRNSFINENGEIDAHAFSVPDQFNTITSRIARDNAKRRVFGYDSHYSRNSGNILAGTYEGWTKTDITKDPRFQKYNVGNGDGITISQLKRDKPKANELNEGIVIEIDASNIKGYQKTKELIEKLKIDNVMVTSYRIKNMGAKDSSQKFKDILEALPDELPQLELFFTAAATNTSSLIALENKRIKELSLYTLGNSLLENWSYNPWSFKKVEWINTIDYNVSSDYPKNSNVATRITFDTLAFDAVDYIGDNNFERINNGLRMVYYTRNNEPFFQGSFGGGLKPDFNEGGNSYPTGLDFTRLPIIKTLRGLVFHDIEKPSNKARKIKRVTFYNNNDYYEISQDELSNAGFENLTIGEMEKPKIKFSNGGLTNKIRLSGSQILSASAITNLNRFYEFNESLKSSKTIQIPEGANELRTQLSSLGFNVEIANDIQFT